MTDLKVVKDKRNSTDMSLLVQAQVTEEIFEWNREKIVESLQRETHLQDPTIQEIADLVEERIKGLNLEKINTTRIREVINDQLLQKGYNLVLEEYSPLSIPFYDVDNLLFDHNSENSNTTYNPESINLTLAETILKQYALRKVFSKEVSEAHLCGDIHLHDLGMSPVRPYCGGHSIEYIKKFGLSLPSITSSSKPAKHADVLVGHIVKMASTLQSNYAGAVGFDAVNMFFAPFLKEMEYKEVKQIAQMLIFEFNQLAGARGGQVVFSDFNLYYGIPERYQDTPALLPGAKYAAINKDNEVILLDEPKLTKKYEEYRILTYSDYEEESNLFLKALFEVYLDGDANGKTFFFPKPLLHINDESIKAEGWDEFFSLACKVASKQGITYFVFDRGEKACISQCCRLKLELDSEDIEDAKRPEHLRFTALQNVSINLPRLAYKAKGNDDILWEELDKALELASKAHLEKKKFIKKLVNLGEKGPLCFFSQNHDGQAYLKMNKLTFLIGIIGLNEMVQYHTGKQLHESKTSYEFGLKFIEQMQAFTNFKSGKYNIKMVLEETPAESSAYRLASLDLQNYNGNASKVIKGDITNGGYYYTNSVHYAVDADIDYISRIKGQSKFHPLIQAGAIIHVWLGEHEPCVESIKKLVNKTFEKTECEQLVFSPEFTICNDCNKNMRGLKNKCSYCKSTNVYQITRIVGYFSIVSNWNSGKRGELQMRNREKIDN